MKHTLEISGIRLLFGERLILSDIFLAIDTGEVVGLLGRNGCGKTSLMRVILGVLPTEKSIILDEKSLYEAYKHPELIRYLPQHNFIPKRLTLKRIFQDFALDFSAFILLFPEFTQRLKTKIGHLSGGMRRLVELYVIIKSPSKFVLLDEPFTHVSPKQIDKVKSIIDEERTNKGFLVTDHLYRHIMEFSDRAYMMHQARLSRIIDINDLRTLKYIN